MGGNEDLVGGAGRPQPTRSRMASDATMRMPAAANLETTIRHVGRPSWGSRPIRADPGRTLEGGAICCCLKSHGPETGRDQAGKSRVRTHPEELGGET